MTFNIHQPIKISAKVKLIIWAVVILLIFWFYKSCEYTQQRIYPQQTEVIALDEKISMRITCSGDWIKNTYGPPYDLLISVKNVHEHQNIKIEQLSIMLNDHEISIPVNRIKREYMKDSHEVYFSYKYFKADFSATEEIQYKITLSIDNKRFEKILSTKIINESLKINRLFLVAYQ